MRRTGCLRAGLMVAALMVAGVPLGARADQGPDRAAIQAVIAQQIEAFRHDDAQGAYHFAAPSIQHLFGDAAGFMAMVRNAYQPVYHPQSYSFGTLSAEQGVVVQRVELIGPDGRSATAFYTMEQEPDGTWRISGCTLAAGEDQA